MSEFSDFILLHEDDDTDRLLLNKDKFPGIDIRLAVNTILSRRKLKGKVPFFHANAGLIYPNTLSAEQCSGEFAARNKALLAVDLVSGDRRPRIAELAGSDKKQRVANLENSDRKPRIADLTGGLGVDCAAFAEVAEQVLYNEMNPELADAARHNFAALGIENIQIRNAEIVAKTEATGIVEEQAGFERVENRVAETTKEAATKTEAKTETTGIVEEQAGFERVENRVAETTKEAATKTVEKTETTKEAATKTKAKTKATNVKEAETEATQQDRRKSVSGLLHGFCPDVIFIDPARRAEDGKKVFLLEDCKPDILKLKDELLQEARFVIVKLSPMADIDMVLSRLSSHCRLVEVLSVRGECKELIVVLDREFNGERNREFNGELNGECNGECRINANCNGSRFCFTKSEESQAEADYLAEDALTCEGKLLLEPDKALMKAAPFKLLCKRFGLKKLEKSTHFYVKDPKDDSRPCPAGLFKAFSIIKVLPMDKKSLRIAAADYPKAEITARNIRMDSGTLRKKLGSLPSDDFHIFALKTISGNRLFICKRL